MVNKIKRSLSLKTSLILLLLSVCALVFSWIYASEFAKNSLKEHYRNIMNITTLCGDDCIEDYVNESEDAPDKLHDFGKDIQKLCENDVLDMFYIAQKNKDDSNQCDVLVLVTEDELHVKGLNDYSYICNLNKDEMKIIKKEKEETSTFYKARVGTVKSFIRGMDVVNEKTGEVHRIMIGCNVKTTSIASNLRHMIIHQFIMTAVLLLAYVVLVGIIIRQIAVVPFQKLSDHMSHFVQNGHMTFEPLAIKGCDERANVAQHFNQMACDIKNYVECVKDYERESQKNLAEIKIASDIQKGLLPKETYTASPFIVTGYMEPAKNVGGDLYYYERLDENRLAFAIGDVSGKGISAALFMANTVSAIKYNLKNCTSPAKALGAINNDLVDNNPNRMFVTLFVGILDAREHTLTYANAGHNPPYKIAEKAEALTEAGGLLAGIFKDEEYEDAVVNIGENETILLYTDGVTEALNKKNEFFGQEKLEQILNDNRDVTIPEILKDLKTFTEGAEQNDDITMLTLCMGCKEKR